MKHTSIFLLTLVLLLVSSTCFGQAESLKLSLKEAIDYGLKNRKDVINQQINIQLAENEIDKVRARSLPQISAGFDFRYNTKLQAGFIAAGLFANPDPLVLRFGAPYTSVAGINANYEIFNPATVADKQIAQKNVALTQANAEKNLIEVKLAIAQVYYIALLDQEREKFSENNLIRTQAYYKEGKNKFDNKTIPQNDVDRLKLDYENAKITYEESIKNSLLSKMYLANQLGATLNVNISLSENLAEVLNSVPESIIKQADLNKRIEIQQEQLKLDYNQLNIKKQTKIAMPTFALYGSWSSLQVSSDFQFFNGQWWFPFHFVGFRMNMTLFDGMLRNKTKYEYKLRETQSQNALAKLQSDIAYEQASSKIQLQNAFSKLKTAKGNYTLAENIIEIDNVRFKEGKITLSELNNAEYTLATAQNNLLTFYYNFLMAKLNYQKSVGEL
ncbi:MAG: TolC family protein [Cytophagales bacterium]|nr:MAG: TolC family protein [Cytophagales bacterium]